VIVTAAVQVLPGSCAPGSSHTIIEARAKQQYVSGFGLALIYDAPVTLIAAISRLSALL